MTPNEKDFVKNIRDYFGIEMSELDEKRICFYLNQYRESEMGGMKQLVIKKEEKVVRYVYRPRVRKTLISDDEMMEEAVMYCKDNFIDKAAFLMPPSKVKKYNRRTPTSIVNHRIKFCQLMVKQGASMTQLGNFFKVHHTTALYYIDPIQRKSRKQKSAA